MTMPSVEALVEGIGQVAYLSLYARQRPAPKTLADHEARTGCGLLLVAMRSASANLYSNKRAWVEFSGADFSPRIVTTLGIGIHGTFILGLPGETKENDSADAGLRQRDQSSTIQVSLAAPYPESSCTDRRREGWLAQRGKSTFCLRKETRLRR